MLPTLKNEDHLIQSAKALDEMIAYKEQEGTS